MAFHNLNKCDLIATIRKSGGLMFATNEPREWAPYPRIVHLQIYRPTNSPSLELLVAGELRCGVDTISDADGNSYEIGFRKLTLRIFPEGCAIKPGARAGDIQKPNKAMETVEKTDIGKYSANTGGHVKVNGSIEAKVKNLIPSIGASNKIEGNISYESTDITENQDKKKISIQRTLEPVVSNGKDEILVESIDQDVLRSVYLQDGDICTLISDNPDDFAVKIEVYFQPKDLVICNHALNSNFFRRNRTPNKDAVLRILIAELMREGQSHNDLTKITIAADQIIKSKNECNG